MNTKRKGTIRFCTDNPDIMGGHTEKLHSNGSECRLCKALSQKIDPMAPTPVHIVRGVGQKYFGVFVKKRKVRYESR